MKIIELCQNTDNTINLKILAGEPEFRHLKGYTDLICMFATQTINEPVKTTKTGARHSFAKWFLLPVKLRSKYDAEEYDYEGAKAGCVEYKDCVFFVYRVDKKGYAGKNTVNGIDISLG